MEVLTLAVMQVLLGYSSERRWLRYARQHLQVMFPALPGQSGYNKRVRKLAATMTWLVRELGAQTTVASDEVWQLDLEAPGGRTTLGVCARIAQRVLALTTAIWHNDKLGLPTRRSLTAYDH